MVKDRFEVEVVYALSQKQYLLTTLAKPGMDVQAVIVQSGILKRCPQIDLSKQKVGVFSRIVPLDYVVQYGDRIEIYRELLADPKEIRKQRAARAQQARQADQATGARTDARSKH